MSIKDQINNSYKPKQEPIASTCQEVAEDIFERACKHLTEDAQNGCVKQRHGFLKSQKYVEYKEGFDYPILNEKGTSLHRVYEDGKFWHWYIPNRRSEKHIASILRRLAKPEGIQVVYIESYHYYMFTCDIE